MSRKFGILVRVRKQLPHGRNPSEILACLATAADEGFKSTDPYDNEQNEPGNVEVNYALEDECNENICLNEELEDVLFGQLLEHRMKKVHQQR